MEEKARRKVSTENGSADKRWREVLLPMQSSLFDDATAPSGQHYWINSERLNFEQRNDIPAYLDDAKILNIPARTCPLAKGGSLQA